MRNRWSQDEVRKLTEVYPHFGTKIACKVLKKSTQQIRSKVDKLHITKLPKEQRRCYYCDDGFQFSRRGGLRCRQCFSAHRKTQRKNYLKTEHGWIREHARVIAYRNESKKNPADYKYLVSLWEKQNGICFYSGVEMVTPNTKEKRSIYSASLDRIDSNKPYQKGNVVWCCWGCNAGKNEWSAKEYIDLCTLVAKQHQP